MTANELVDIIDSYNEYLQRIKGSGILIANLLREENESEALEKISQLAEGLDWLSKVSEICTTYDISTSFNVSELTDALNELNDGLSIKDYVLAADILEYEINPFLEKCEQIQHKA